MKTAEIHEVLSALSAVAYQVQARGQFGDLADEALRLERDAISILAGGMPANAIVPIQCAEEGPAELLLGRPGLVVRSPGEREHVVIAQDWEDSTEMGELCVGGESFRWLSRVEGLNFARLVVGATEFATFMTELHRRDSGNWCGDMDLQTLREVQHVIRSIAPVAPYVASYKELHFGVKGVAMSIDSRGLAMRVPLVPTAALTRALKGTPKKKDAKWGHQIDGSGLLSVGHPDVFSCPLAGEVADLLVLVAEAMATAGGIHGGRGQALLQAMTPWLDLHGWQPKVSPMPAPSANGTTKLATHKWRAVRSGPDQNDIVEERDHDTLTIWRCDECGCRAVGYTERGPAAAAFECYWRDGKPVDRHPFEFMELFGDPPIDGTKPPPATCAEVKARASEVAS